MSIVANLLRTAPNAVGRLGQEQAGFRRGKEWEGQVAKLLEIGTKGEKSALFFPVHVFLIKELRSMMFPSLHRGSG